jgi:hypothetical protein
MTDNNPYREKLEAALEASIDNNAAKFQEILSDIIADKAAGLVADAREGMSQTIFTYADPDNDDYSEEVTTEEEAEEQPEA